MIQLTTEQRHELDGPGPARAVDPETNKTYVLVRSDLYERIEGLLEDDMRQMQHLLADLSPEDWEDASAYGSTP